MDFLIVDDQPFNVIALEGILVKYGAQYIEKAYDGEMALAKILENQNRANNCPYHKGRNYRFVFLDNQMPIKSGK